VETSLTIAVVQPGGEELRPLLALYERAIPANERKSRQTIEQLIRSRVYRVSVLQQGPTFLGFSILYLGSRVRLLEYLAVDERFRGKGLGARLYKDARLQAGHLPMLVEVESTRDAGADLEQRTRRLAFYGRLGCRRIDGLHYILPLTAGGDPPSMDLLLDGFQGVAISRATVRDWLEDIYVGAYGCAADDPRLDQMLGHDAADFSLASATA
jgi:GNAT superfamily N-acetyltransferase